jgi:hypothetical protein
MPGGANLSGSRHVLLGIPLDAYASGDYLIDRKYWVASSNPNRLVPNWVSWQLVASDLGTLKRPKPEPFAEDTALPNTMTHVGRRDYAGSGYDRGHMCPSADRNTTKDVNKITYLMTNMQPQLRDLNGYPWKALEDFERKLAGDGAISFGTFRKACRRSSRPRCRRRGTVGDRDRSGPTVPSPEPSPSFKRFQKATLRAARAGLSGGFAVMSAEAASFFAPAQHAWLVYAATGGTMVMVYWWVWGKVFKNAGLVVE